MAVIGNNPDSFLHALSDFWTRFFADLGDLQATYESTSILFGQAYLDLLNTVLNTSVFDAPLFRKEYYRLITMREDQLAWAQNFKNSSNSRWVFQPDVELGGAGTFQNKVYAPDAVLAVGIDVDVGPNLRFINGDPTADATLPPYFAHRKVDVAVGGTFSSLSVDWVASGVKKGDVLRVHPYRQLNQGDRVLVDSQAYNIVHVTASELRLSVDTPAPVFPSNFTQTAVSWWIDRLDPTTGAYDSTLPWTARVGTGTTGGQAFGTFGPSKNVSLNEVAVWAVDALVDDRVIYKNFGYLVAHEEASSEAYRALVKGLMQLYIYGPAIDRLESALNVTAHLPVVRNDGEVLTSYDNGGTQTGVNGSFGGGQLDVGVPIFTNLSVGGYVQITRANDARNVGIWRITSVSSASVVQLEVPGGMWAQAGGVHWEFSQTDLQTVKTTGGTYEFDRRIPMRTDITGWNGTDVITFQAFEALTLAFQVVDYIKDPEWWFGLPVPVELLPNTSLPQRVANTHLLQNKVGAEYHNYVGDPGFYVGADENGTLYNAVTHPNLYHHYPAFILMDRFLKTHIFQVKISPQASLSGLLLTDFANIMKEAKPAYTYMYLQPGTQFGEPLAVSEYFVDTPTAQFFEAVDARPNTLVVGATGTQAWTVGEKWKYTGSVFAGPSYGTGATFMVLVVGGIHPAMPTVSGLMYESPLSALAV